MQSRRCGWMCVLVALGASAQRPAPIAKPREITFTSAKPVLGLPGGIGRGQALCSSDGLTYFRPSSNAADAPDVSSLDLYSVSASAEVKHFRRAGPKEGWSVSIQDFFPGDHTLATLLEADEKDDRDPTGPPRERHYFLSLSDHDGDHSDLLPLKVGFTPFRIAAFDSGEYLALGWEEANQLPQIAVLKDDGTLRRFVDLDDRQEWRAAHPNATEPPPAPVAATRDSLAKARFVPFGKSVLLTYPGTTRPVRVMSAIGQDRVLALAIPAGFVLRDVLVTGNTYTIVARVQSAEKEPVEGEKATAPVQRIFEFNAFTGGRGREFTFSTQTPADVTCAANSSIIAIYLDAVGDAAAGATATKDAATQLWVGTVQR